MTKIWGRLALGGMIAATLVGTAGASMQDSSAQQQYDSATALQLPENPQLFGQSLPSVVKATAIVNGEIITQTDIDHRVALALIAGEAEATADEINQLRQQALANLIDEALQIQAAKVDEMEVTEAEVDNTLARVAQNANHTPQSLAEFLEASGSSIHTLRRQIEGELAWQRLQERYVESSVSVGDDEVQAVIDRLNASKGQTEYRVGEIYLSSIPATDADVQANAQRILQQLSQGASFTAYARQYSEASTAAVGGDLGWVRPEQLPDELAAALRTMRAGSLSIPIKVPGGWSILAVQDTRTILTADPRNAVLSLKQVSITFAPGTTEEKALPEINSFADAALNVGGCGGAERIANQFGGDVVSSDNVRLKDLPPALQDMMLPMQVGQATQPFGSIEDGVRVLVICGRDEEKPGVPSYDEVFNRLNEERVNLRARRYLRDLRRDAIIDFR